MDFKYNDFTGSFNKPFGHNFLIQELGLFKEKHSDTPKIETDDLREGAIAVAESVNRYGTELIATERPLSRSRLLEIPHWALSGEVDTSSWQGIRRPGTQRQQTMDELVSDEAIRQYLKFRTIKEDVLATCLFKGIVNAPYTQQKVIDMEEEFGSGFSSAVISVNLPSAILETLDTAATDLRVSLGGWVKALSGMLVLCSPEFYKKVKYSEEIRVLVQQGVLPDSTLFNVSVRANLPAYQAFELDGLTFVNAVGYEKYISAGEAFMVPVFADNIVQSDHSPREVISGPASRNARIAASGVQSPFYAWSLEDRLGNRTVQAEFGVLPLQYDLSMTKVLSFDV